VFAGARVAAEKHLNMHEEERGGESVRPAFTSSNRSWRVINGISRAPAVEMKGFQNVVEVEMTLMTEEALTSAALARVRSHRRRASCG